MDWLRLPGRVPLRLRVFFRGAFLLLALATLALALHVLQDEKQRRHQQYADGLRKSQAQIAARLRHPTGQLALLNAAALERAPTPVRPWLLPFSAIDFDDRSKAQQAVEMAGCALQYPDTATLCVGVGANPYAGGFVYVVGTLLAGALQPHTPGELDLTLAHRVVLTLAMRGESDEWTAPYEIAADGRGRLVAFAGGTPLARGAKPVRDFRGWLWQEARCADAARDDGECPRRTTVSLRLPVPAFQQALAARQPRWPPPDLADIVLRVQLLPPGDGAPLFDSDAAGASAAFPLAELRALLQPGETLRVRREGRPAVLIELRGAEQAEPTSPWLGALVRRLPVEGFEAPVVARETISTPLARYELTLEGDVRSVNQALAAAATRLAWFVAAMLAAVLLTWLALELRIMRRVTLLTRRAAAVSSRVRTDAAVGAAAATLDLADLKSSDELGVLAQGLQDLLLRVNEAARREQIRAAQEKEQWHAVGHEIVSPLQALLALHGQPGDPAARYLRRMQQALRVLYGQASPGEAFEATQLDAGTVDLDAFLAEVAANARYIGIDGVAYTARGTPLPVRADEHALEDAVSHVLRNAARHREPGTPITLAVEGGDREAHIRIHNRGAPIAPAVAARIFEYGVSGADEPGGEHRGQGLFVARTYLAKMGGTIAAHDVEGGVEFVLTLQRAG